jgi:hypothetical protein
MVDLTIIIGVDTISTMLMKSGSVIFFQMKVSYSNYAYFCTYKYRYLMKDIEVPLKYTITEDNEDSGNHISIYF